MESMNEELQQKIEFGKDEIARLSREAESVVMVTQLQEQSSLKEEQMASLRREIEATKEQHLADLRQIESELRDAAARLDTEQRVTSQQREELMDQKERLTQETEERERLAREIESEKAITSQQREELECLKKMVSQETEQRERLAREIETEKATTNQVKQEMESMRQRLTQEIEWEQKVTQQLREELERLRERLSKETQDNQSQKDRVTHDLENHKEKLADLEKQYQELKESSKEDTQRLLTQVASLQSTIEARNEQILALKGDGEKRQKHLGVLREITSQMHQMLLENTTTQGDEENADGLDSTGTQLDVQKILDRFSFDTQSTEDKENKQQDGNNHLGTLTEENLSRLQEYFARRCHNVRREVHVQREALLGKAEEDGRKHKSQLDQANTALRKREQEVQELKSKVSLLLLSLYLLL